MNFFALALLTIGALAALAFVFWPLGGKTPSEARTLSDDALEALLAARRAERRQAVLRCPRCDKTIPAASRSCPQCGRVLSP